MPTSAKIALLLFAWLSSASAALTAAENWRPLWDGKSFTGWHVIGKGRWTIEDGAIHGSNVKTEQEFGHLVTDDAYGNFTVRLKFKVVRGNSGLYFRVEEKGASGVSGFQAEIDATVNVGGLYETNGRGWVMQPTATQVASWFQPDAWNEMTVTARDGHIVVHVNGRKSAELANDPGRKTGQLALQLHARQNCDVWFKDLEILVP